MRDDTEIVGWDADLLVHREQHRLAGRFLDFVRSEARARMAPADYWTNVAPLQLQHPTTQSTSPFVPLPLVAPYTANSYTMSISGALGARWAVFPSSVSWFSGTTQEPGAPGGGVTAIQTAITSWDNDCGSNVNYVYAGVDDGSHTQGLHAVDGRNTVLFERDLSAWGVSPFTCNANGYSGTLGIGGVTNASGQNSVNGETFFTTTEGNVEMNRGLANCTATTMATAKRSSVAEPGQWPGLELVHEQLYDSTRESSTGETSRGAWLAEARDNLLFPGNAQTMVSG